ncbi:MAG: cation diffusion facilitator family transporter [Trueperaceae bacterium]
MKPHGHSHDNLHDNLHDNQVAGASDGRILGTVALNLLLTVAQAVGGFIAGSVALMADALHNLNDAMALVIVYAARRISRRSPDRTRTFGYRRAQVVGATINLVALAVVGLFLAYESLLRLFEPREVDGWIMIGLAGVALLVDAITVLLLFTMRRGSVNVRAAFAHNLSDALASLAVLSGGIAILTLGWNWLDGFLSLLIVGYIFWQVARMLPETLRVLMESTPAGLDLNEVVSAMTVIEGVQDAHHLHVWLLDENRCALEAHVVIGSEQVTRMEKIKGEIRQRLREEFAITHTTLELELPETAGEAGHDTALVSEHCSDPRPADG